MIRPLLRKLTNHHIGALLFLMMITSVTVWGQETIDTYYIDENGTRHDVTAYVITGAASLDANKWYIVNSDVNIETTGHLWSHDDIHLILADGKTFTISSNHTDGILSSSFGTINIYGQTLGTGTINVHATGESGVAIGAYNGINIIGCKVNATSDNAWGMNSVSGNITIIGGQVTATGSSSYNGIKANNTTLGWSKPTDSFYTNSLIGNLKVKDGQWLTDGTNFYSGTLDNSQKSAIAGKTLYPDLWGIADGANGSQENPFVISTTYGLDLLAKLVNGGKKYDGKYFVLDKDLDYSSITPDANGCNYTPVGCYEKPFCGHFDGQKHTICGITFNNGNSGEANGYAGIFGSLGTIVGSTSYRGSVKNLILANSTIKGYHRVGGIVGYNNYSIVSNCRVESDVTIIGHTASVSHGGIVGQNGQSAQVLGCVSAATVNNSFEGSTHDYGGIVGYHGGLAVKDCLFLGSTVSANSGTGAIIGHNASSEPITNNYYIDSNLKGVNGSDVDGARLVRTITLDDGISISGDQTTYNVSGITAYGNTVLSYNNGTTTTIYSGEGATVTLSATPAEGYIAIYSVNGTPIEGNSFTMPASDVAITVNYEGSYTINSWGYNCTNYEFPENTSGFLEDNAEHKIAFSAVAYREEKVRTIFIEREAFTAAVPGTYKATVNDNDGIPVVLELTILEPTTHVVTNNNINEIFSGTGNTLGDQINPGDILDFQGVIDMNRYLVINKRVNIISSTKDGQINLHTIPSDIVDYIPKFSFVITSGADGSIIKDLFVNCTQTWIYYVRNVALEDMTISVKSINIGEKIGQTAIRFCDNISIDGCSIFTYNTQNSPSVVLYSTNYSVIKNTSIEGQGSVGALLTLDCPNEVYDDAPYENYVPDASHNSIINCFIKTGSQGDVPLIANNNADYTTIDGLRAFGHGRSKVETGNYATLKNSDFHNSCGITLGANSGCYNNKSLSSGTFTIQSGSYAYDNELKNVAIYNNVRFENNSVNGTLTVYSGAGSTITGNGIVSTKEYAVELKSAGNTVTGNSLICSNYVGDAAVKVASGKTNTVENNTGGTPITNEITALAAGDDFSVLYYVPANTTVSIEGDLNVTGEGQKSFIMLFEGARLNIGGKIDAAGKLLNIYAQGSQTAMGEMVVSGAIESAKLYIGSGRVTARSTTAEVSYISNTVTTPSYITLSGSYKGYFTCGGTSRYMYDVSSFVYIDAPGEGYANCGIEVDATPEGTVFEYMTDHGTMSSYDVTINAVRYYTNDVPYIDADGTEKTTGKTYVLTGWDSELGKSDAETWYLCNRIPANEDDYGLEFVNSDPTLAGNVHLILGDNARMTVGNICGNDNDNNENATRYALHIYGQHLPVAYSDADDNLGQLVAQAPIALYNFKTLAIHGGSVICEQEPAFGQNSIYTKVFAITGGHFDSKGCIGNDIGDYAASFDWTSPYDCYKLYGDISNVSIAENKVLYARSTPNGTRYLRSGDNNIPGEVTITPYGYGGYCGKIDVSYGKLLTRDVTIDKTTLTIKGNGESSVAMRDYDSHAPWSSYGFTYANINAGVSSIGNNAFEDCDDMTLILVPDETKYAYFVENWNDDKRALLAPGEISIAKNESGWSTYCHNYPVEYALSEGATAYTVSGISGDGNSIAISEAIANVAPAVPLLMNYSGTGNVTLTAIPDQTAISSAEAIVSTNGENGVTFYGNCSNIDLEASAIDFINVGSNSTATYVLYDGRFLLADSNQGLKAHRCVLNVSNAGPNQSRSLSIGGEGTTAMSEVNGEEVNCEEWYDLSGRRLEGKPAKKGVYIHNGKKEVVR